MKPSYLTVFAAIATLVAGYMLVQHSVDDREIWIAMGAWLLGFWFASGINSARSAEAAGDDDEDDDEDEYAGDSDDEEDWDEEEEERDA